MLARAAADDVTHQQPLLAAGETGRRRRFQILEDAIVVVRRTLRHGFDVDL
jgi:hypothetical protein